VKILFTLSLAVLSILISFIVIEWGLRIYGSYHNMDFRLFAKELKNSDRLPEALMEHGKPKAGAEVLATTSDFSVFYTINSFGMRDREYALGKPENITRVGAFGDSFTFGEGVAYGKRFTDVLEDNLQDTEVLNFGFPGAGLDNVVSEMFNVGFQFNLDYAVVFVSKYILQRGGDEYAYLLDYESGSVAGASDFQDSTHNTLYLSRNDPFFDYQPSFWLRHSYVLSYIHYRQSIAALQHEMEQYDKEFWDGYAECEQNPPCDMLTHVDLQQRTIELFDKVLQVCNQRGMTLVVVNIDKEPLPFFYEEPPPFIYIDLHKDLREFGKHHQLTFTYDHHYNEKTHAFIGERITSLLKQHIDKRVDGGGGGEGD
jgi:hypothetical protein